MIALILEHWLILTGLVFLWKLLYLLCILNYISSLLVLRLQDLFIDLVVVTAIAIG